jgi:hypothetical protein
MKRIFLIVFLFIYNATVIRASDEHIALGARSAGMANATVMLPDFWSVFQNQAGLAYQKKITAGFYHKSGFVQEADRQAMALVVPTSTGTLASSFSYYGYTHYHETKCALAYGRFLTENLAAGVQLDYFNTRITGIYGKADLLTFEAGILIRIPENFYLGTHVFNPLRIETGTNNENVPSMFRFGAGYLLNEKALICLEAEKASDRKVIPKLGMEYQPVDDFFIRAGISVNPVMNYFGLGYSWKSLQADLAFSYHRTLGYLPDFSLCYEF